MNHAKDDDLVAHDLVRDREQETRDDVAAHSDTSAGHCGHARGISAINHSARSMAWAKSSPAPGLWSSYQLAAASYSASASGRCRTFTCGMHVVPGAHHGRGHGQQRHPRVAPCRSRSTPIELGYSCRGGVIVLFRIDATQQCAGDPEALSYRKVQSLGEYLARIGHALSLAQTAVDLDRRSMRCTSLMFSVRWLAHDHLTSSPAWNRRTGRASWPREVLR
jgi:hypothetical protein